VSVTSRTEARSFLEKPSDASFLREMIGFAAERLMQLETEHHQMRHDPELVPRSRSLPRCYHQPHGQGPPNQPAERVSPI
jgi:hypothetical protein